MTKNEIIDALIKGSTGHNARFVNVRRDHLLIALGAAPEPAQTQPTEEAPHVAARDDSAGADTAARAQ